MVQRSLGTMALRFFFNSVTDLALIPALAVMARRGRHFELFMGIFQWITSTCYNLCDSLGWWKLFLPSVKWKQFNNVSSITLGCFVLIFLMGNKNEKRDHLLRYVAFALTWITQSKDEYWMEGSHYTVYVPSFFGVLLVIKIIADPPNYNVSMAWRGIVALFIAGMFFGAALDDITDEYKMLHGMSQVFVGVALYYLWQMIPPNNYETRYKKTDTLTPAKRSQSLGDFLVDVSSMRP
eukprot:m.35637 g.35637  ORF g.35637 m.35637 type:complete len:237 (+) comp8916_c0_seq1:230-940(+)